jgi:polar amino acid transport system substrate-binding protein
MADGILDMTVSAIETPDREKFARFVIVSWDHDEILAQVRPDFPASPESFLADRSLLVGTVKSFRYSPGVDEWVNALRAQNRAYEAPDLQTLFKVFDAGRVAAIPVEPEATSVLGQRYHLTHTIQRLDWFEHSKKVAGGLALSRSRLPEAVATRFQKEVETMRRDGTLLRIGEKYIDRADAMDMLKPD